MALTQEEAIQNCIKVHGDLYDYSKAVYIGSSKKMEIICKIHGSFWQTYNGHVNGKKGCNKCHSTFSMTTESFIEKAQKIQVDENGNPKYLYHKTKIINNRIRVIITCPIHGDFLYKPNNHLDPKRGCPKCNKRYRYSQQEFIDRANKTFNNLYDYSNSIYVNSFTKLIVSCKIHGDFLVTPSDHIRAMVGCPKCSSSHGEKFITTILERNNINFIFQKTFDDCRYKRKLRFDFYIPEINTIIEYDGWQHFCEIEQYGGESVFKLQEIKDDIKNSYCSDKNIPMIRLPYWLSNEDLENILVHDLIQLFKEKDLQQQS